MTDGGYTKTEAWNLQLQAKVTRLEKELSDCNLALAEVRKERDAMLNVVWAAEPLLNYAEEMVLDIAAGIQEGGDGTDLPKWNNFVSAIRAFKDTTKSGKEE